MANIFNIDWNNVSKNLIPWFWRETSTGEDGDLVSFVAAIMAPIQTLSDELKTYRDELVVYLNYTGQHKALEEYLNDTYDTTLRRIYITENNIAAIDAVNMYLTGETNPEPLSFYLTGESPPVPINFYLTGEVLVDNNFTVNIPTSIVYNSTVLTAQLRNYVEASKNFNFVTF